MARLVFLRSALAAGLLVAGDGLAAAKDAASEALLKGIRAGDVAAVEAALEGGADPNHATIAPMLVLAASRGSAELTAALLAAGADPDASDGRGRPALAVAGAKGHLEVVEALLEGGADVEAREQSPGRTILQLIIDDSDDISIDVLAAILDAGADIEGKDERGETALASAAFMGRMDTAKFLVERGADPRSTNKDGVTPIEWAQRNGNPEIMELLAAIEG